MWWHDHRSTVARFAGLAAALALSTLLGRLLRAAVRREDAGRRAGIAPAAELGRDRPDHGAERLAAGADRRRGAERPELRPHRRRRPDRARPTSSGSTLSTQNQQVIVDITTARAGRAAIRHQRHLYAGRDRDRQSGGDRHRPSRACPTTIPGSSSGSPTRAASATPKTAPPRSFPKTSSRAWRRISPPARSLALLHSRAERWSRSKPAKSIRSWRAPVRSGRSCWCAGRTPAWCTSAPKRSSTPRSTTRTIRSRWFASRATRSPPSRRGWSRRRTRCRCSAAAARSGSRPAAAISPPPSRPWWQARRPTAAS